MSKSRTGEVVVDTIENAIAVEEIDRDLYRSIELWKPAHGRGVFGGQIIAQALWAATLSVRRDQPGTLKGLHSLSSYFLNFGDAEKPVLYKVERLRDGRSYSTRTVLATQVGIPIFTLTCSFCLQEPKQPIAQFPMPTWPLTAGGSNNLLLGQGHKKVPEPEDCLPTEDRMQQVLDGGLELPRKMKEYIERNQAERRQSSIEVRNVDLDESGDLLSSRKGPNPLQAQWFRSRAPVKRDSSFQKCVLAYASDMSFIGTAARAAGLGNTSKPRLAMMASLSHSMMFYDDDIDCSDFLLFYMECPIVSNGRGTVTGRIYKRDGTLAVVCTQEGVVRASLEAL